MKIGLLLNSDNRLFPNYTLKIEEILVKNNLPYVLIDPNSGSLMEDLKGCTHLLFRHSQGDTDILLYNAIYQIAKNVFHLKCSPEYETFWQYENKVREYYLLKSHNFPLVETHIFWNYNHAETYLGNTTLPVVAKLSKGAGSSNVVLIKTIGEGKKILNQIFRKGVKPGFLKHGSNLASLRKMGVLKFVKSSAVSLLTKWRFLKEFDEYTEWQIQKDAIIFQKYLPGNQYDTRITIIGDRALAFRRSVRKKDFRASGSGLLHWDPSTMDTRCVEIAFTVSKKLNFETMAYDFIYDENNNPAICEISYCFVDWIVQKCPGYWDDKLKWHPGQNWPQYYQLADFLGMSDLISI